MHLLNNFHIQSLGIGGVGYAIADITPSNVSDFTHLSIVVITALIQIIHLFKKNKNEK